VQLPESAGTAKRDNLIMTGRGSFSKGVERRRPRHGFDPRRAWMFAVIATLGASVVTFANNPGRVANKTWWIDGKDMLCRIAGKKYRENCAKIAAFGGNAIEFLAPSGKPRFGATLLEGRQLPE
jgi:hypothetical protein